MVSAAPKRGVSNHEGRAILRYHLFFLSSFGAILLKSKITQDDLSRS